MMGLDVNEIIAKDKKKRNRTSKCQRILYQMLTFFLCFVKLYLISILQGVVTFYAVEIEPNTVQMRLSFFFGLLLIGSIIDNKYNPKSIAIGLQIGLALTWACLGLNNEFIYRTKQKDSLYLLHPLEDLAQIFSAGIIVINIL